MVIRSTEYAFLIGVHGVGLAKYRWRYCISLGRGLPEVFTGPFDSAVELADSLFQRLCVDEEGLLVYVRIEYQDKSWHGPAWNQLGWE